MGEPRVAAGEGSGTPRWPSRTAKDGERTHRLVPRGSAPGNKRSICVARDAGAVLIMRSLPLSIRGAPLAVPFTPSLKGERERKTKVVTALEEAFGVVRLQAKGSLSGAHRLYSTEGIPRKHASILPK